jgi:hypothetical protein
MQALPALLKGFEVTSAQTDGPGRSLRESSHWSRLGELPFVPLVVDRSNAKPILCITP